RGSASTGPGAARRHSRPGTRRGVPARPGATRRGRSSPRSPRAPGPAGGTRDSPLRARGGGLHSAPRLGTAGRRVDPRVKVPGTCSAGGGTMDTGVEVHRLGPASQAAARRAMWIAVGGVYLLLLLILAVVGFSLDTIVPLFWWLFPSTALLFSG